VVAVLESCLNDRILQLWNGIDIGCITHLDHVHSRRQKVRFPNMYTYFRSQSSTQGMLTAETQAHRVVPSRRLVGLVLRLAGTQSTKLAARAGWLPMLPADPGRFVSTEAQEMTVSFSSRSPAAAERANRAQSGLKGRARLL
jgi:hypothetical protein